MCTIPRAMETLMSAPGMWGLAVPRMSSLFF